MRENTTWKTANEISARCCSMRRWWNELFRAGGWPWTGMEPDKEAGGGGSFEQMKENVSYGAGRKHHLFFFFFFNFFFNFFNFFFPSSLRSLLFHFFLLSSIHISSIFTYILTSHRIALSPQCCCLLEFFSLISAIRWCLSSSSLCVISFFFFFPLFSFLFFFFFLDHSILFLPSFISTFDFFSYQQAHTPSSIRVSPRFSLLILLYVSRLLNQDARSRCLHNNFPNKAEVVFGIWNGVLWYARGSRINCYGIYVILINV